MKQWIVKLINQLDINLLKENELKNTKEKNPFEKLVVSEEKASLLYLLDVYNKHLFEIENHSVRKVRDKLDRLSKDLISANENKKIESVLFDIRQFFSSYRIDEYTYVQNTFDDFKRIVWDFADQLSEDIQFESSKEEILANNLKDLKEAVEANSIEQLRQKSREFINIYVEYQNQKNELRTKRMTNAKKNLTVLKKQLVEAHNDLNLDHLTQAHNRRSFENYLKKIVQMNLLSAGQYSLIILDIDFFKKINDSYGHDIGDFVLKECVKLLNEVFNKDQEMVARIGGEEFAVILPNHHIDHALVRAENALQRVRNEVFIQGNIDIRFTISMGIAQLNTNENSSDWIKRADNALYQSKNTGRNKLTLASAILKPTKVA